MARLNKLGIVLKEDRARLSEGAEERMFGAVLRSAEFHAQLDLEEFWLKRIKYAMGRNDTSTDNRFRSDRHTGIVYQQVLKELLMVHAGLAIETEEVKPFFRKPYLRVSWSASKQA